MTTCLAHTPHDRMSCSYSREWRTKFNLKWNNNDTIVNYHLNVTYTLEPTRSSGDPKKDKITTLNIPLYVSITNDLNLKLCRGNCMVSFIVGGGGEAFANCVLLLQCFDFWSIYVTCTLLQRVKGHAILHLR